MPLCQKCRQFYPPQFCNIMEDEDFLCEWCFKDIDHILVTQDGGKQYKYTKEQCAKEYKIFLNELKDKKDVRKIISAEKGK